MQVILEGSSGAELKAPAGLRTVCSPERKNTAEARPSVEGAGQQPGEIPPLPCGVPQAHAGIRVDRLACGSRSGWSPIDRTSAMIDHRDLTMFRLDFQMSGEFRRPRLPGDVADGGRMLIDEFVERIIGHDQRTRRPPNATRPRAEGR